MKNSVFLSGMILRGDYYIEMIISLPILYNVLIYVHRYDYIKFYRLMLLFSIEVIQQNMMDFMACLF